MRGRQILDSRGNPTVEVEVEVESRPGRAGCRPVGRVDRAARGRRAARRRSEAPTSARASARRSRTSARRSRQALIGLDGADQAAVDDALISLDGTKNKSRLGANAILGASLATAKAAAADAGVPLYRWVGGAEAHVLPVPMLNVVNGGAHATNSLDLQEFMIVPGGAETFPEGLRIAVEVFHTLKKLLEEAGLSTAVGDEGGFAPDLGSSEEAIERILEAAERAGHRDRDRDRARSGDERGLRRRAVLVRGPNGLVGRARRLLGRACSIAFRSSRSRTGPRRTTGRPGRTLTARLGRAGAARRRRPLRDERRAARARDRGEGRERDPDQGEPDRDADRDARRDRARARERVRRRHVAPLGRDGGHDDRRPRRGDERGPDQDGRAVAQRPRREVQPAAADRGGARRATPSTPAGTLSPRSGDEKERLADSARAAQLR